jgi:large subunit ribosomal protein L37Ae
MATRKVGTAGRFGPRYGKTIRQRVIDVEKKQKGWHSCPYCKKPRVKRVSVGIWECKSCRHKFTGRAYEP